MRNQVQRSADYVLPIIRLPIQNTAGAGEPTESLSVEYATATSRLKHDVEGLHFKCRNSD